MSNPNIERAIWLAGKIAHAEATGQPNLAALYEQNMLQAMQEALHDIAAERIGAALTEMIKFLGEKVMAGFEAVAKFLEGAGAAAQALEESKSDYTLAGPSKGGTP